ncbi:N-acetyl-gamma-glutamyl-phosphate reductase [Jiangella rhizosphaerae]|uniref:N-acetyl-gamma-glutamyl-phosphate reductase n=1 Tax=Jiangella rhizosphaerae TaxID=2293569 RepID=A0A418KIP0_9ACTN|nr:N-acetyl-gamma-glutamyl-phosphate reductase [Jiangella rhizosphaerae]RIQ12947.1 N-acetyl-gamma-glutamyl-phosphate reductase [Jiangella rhizosphaerae]
MGATVAIAGASGYAGGELLRLLLAHPELGVGTVTAHSKAGDRLIAHHPQLIELADRTLEPTTAEALAGHDVVILALPHGTSAQVAAQLPDDVLVLDCGADHRLTDAAAWQRFYGTEHAGSWPYGLPELVRKDGGKQRDALPGAKRIAVPGCNVTAVTLALAPGLAAGVVAPDDIVAVLACGTSGAGKSLKPHLLASEIMGAASPYAVGGVHRHIPEIQQNLQLASGGAPVTLSFTPTLVPMSRGILATVTAKLSGDAGSVRAAWADAYADEPFVHLLPEGQWPTTAAVLGANTAHVQVTVDEAAGRVVAIAAIDNLAKGTAGAAIQSANLALGLPETLGLPTTGVAP